MKEQLITIINKVKNWVGRNSKYIIFILIVLVSSSITYTFFRKEINNPPITIVDYKEVEKWKDKYNNEHNRLVQTQLDNKTFRRQVDSIADLLKVKSQDVESVTSVITKSEVVIKEKITYIDSLKSFGFSKKDNYLALNGVIDRIDSTVDIKLGLVDTLTVVPYKKTKFFKETHYVDITNKNPYNKIVSGYSYSKTDRIKRFGIGPNITYNPIDNKVSYGIGLQYNIIRF